MNIDIIKKIINNLICPFHNIIPAFYIIEENDDLYLKYQCSTNKKISITEIINENINGENNNFHYCLNCQKSIIDIEKNIHNKEHILLNKSFNIRKKCQKHLLENINFYCIECDEHFCSKCITIFHNEHKIVELKKLINEEKFNLKKKEYFQFKKKINLYNKDLYEKIISSFENDVSKKEKLKNIYEKNKDINNKLNFLIESFFTIYEALKNYPNYYIIFNLINFTTFNKNEINIDKNDISSEFYSIKVYYNNNYIIHLNNIKFINPSIQNLNLNLPDIHKIVLKFISLSNGNFIIVFKFGNILLINGYTFELINHLSLYQNNDVTIIDAIEYKNNYIATCTSIGSVQFINIENNKILKETNYFFNSCSCIIKLKNDKILCSSNENIILIDTNLNSDIHFNHIIGNKIIVKQMIQMGNEEIYFYTYSVYSDDNIYYGNIENKKSIFLKLKGFNYVYSIYKINEENIIFINGESISLFNTKDKQIISKMICFPYKINTNLKITLTGHISQFNNKILIIINEAKCIYLDINTFEIINSNSNIHSPIYLLNNGLLLSQDENQDFKIYKL